jgi:hypothetical protein
VGDLLKIAAVALLALGVTATAIGPGRDTNILVPPPEAVAEEFARQIATRRYDRAMDQVAPDSGISLTSVRLGGDELHARHGHIDQVEGEAGTIAGEAASAAAIFRTERSGEVRHDFTFVRRHGLWKIREWTISR